VEIVSLGVALFEIHVDLNGHAGVSTKDVPDFRRRLLEAMPTLAEHRCCSGDSGGFSAELEGGTDLAHVMEHVALELQHLTDPEGRRYCGSTRRSGGDVDAENDRYFTIHFQTRSFEVGSAAARWAVRIVTRLISNEDPKVRYALRELQALPW
jgi:cyanophycin synthetase